MWRASNSAIRTNVISGNDADGLSLVIGASSNLVSNNLIGLRADGLAALPNGHNGVTLYDGASNNTFDGNIISGNTGVGVDIQKNSVLEVTGTRFLNNTIGLDATGAALANGGGGIRLDTAPGTIVGEPGAGNTIGGNAAAEFSQGGPGIVVLGSPATRPVIRANRIGTDATGNLARPNRYEGIYLAGPAQVGGGGAGEGNRIAGNGNASSGQGTGIAVIGAGASGSVIQGNVIGLAANGAALGNGYSGITVYGGVQGSLIGGDVAGEANTIAGNAAAGVTLYTDGNAWPHQITVAGNAIYGNGGLGIDLDNDSVTPNEPADVYDTAKANGGQNFPVLSNARNGAVPTTMVDFTVSTLIPAPYTLRFFANTACDASGHGEGERFVGALYFPYGLGGNPAGSMVLSEAVPAGQFITATATNRYGETSEFSACTPVTTPPTVIGPLGGTGGSAFGPYFCPGGTTAVGFRVATNDTPVNDPWGGINYALTTAEVLCSDGSSTAKFGGTTIPNTALSCAPGDRMVGMVGSLSGCGRVGGVAPRCQSPLGGAITEPWAARPSGFSNAGPFDCPAGLVVKAVQGRQGAVVDQIQLVCAMP